MKKILIITYYWPPAGGIAVQRWLKFVKYLPENGWIPVVVIPENPAYPIIQKEYERDVPTTIEIIKVPVFELNRPPRNSAGKQIHLSLITNHKKSIKDTFKTWIRGNLILPDARVFWIRPVVKKVLEYLKTNHIEVLVTNGPPHSLHLAGLKIKKKHPELLWMADFRDPWTKINYYNDLKPWFLSDYLQKRWERKVVQQADLVTTVSQSGTDEFLELNPKSIYTLSNGFDADDYPSSEEIKPKDERFVVRYVGSLMANQNYPEFWKLLHELLEENQELQEKFTLEFVGNIDFEVRESIKDNKLENFTRFIGYVSANEAVAYQQSAHALLIFINRTGNPKGMMTGKIFGYIASRRPIILIGPEDGNAADLVRFTESGTAFDGNAEIEIKMHLLSLFDQFKQGQVKTTGNTAKIESLTRRNLTRELSAVLLSHLNNKKNSY